ncbi:MAG: hydrogenase iron-sulfur subunit, partial [Desulfobacterota bacterium]|nr:hydrogenase iron-sulfur subunit [Thermodesulfobacteriota bacterium]
GGLAALEAASRLIDLGYEVVLAEPAGPGKNAESAPKACEDEMRERLRQSAKALIRERAQVKDIRGFAGDFLADLETAAGPHNEAVGAVILAPALLAQDSDYPVLPETAGNWMMLDQLHGAIAFPAGAPEGFRSLAPDSYVALAVGLQGSGSAAEMAEALNGALKIREKYGARVYVFTGQIKVAEEGLERLYMACRDAGVVFFKFDENLPEFSMEEGRPVIRFVDTLVAQPLELSPELLITDSAHVLPEAMRTLAAEGRVGLDRSGLLQPANVHLQPYQTLREGIFVAGPGRQGPLLFDHELEEARGAVLAVHHFFQGREMEFRDREVIVDQGLCTVCLTCLRYCPHQAIGWTHRVFIHPLACRRCGICAGECPMDAIQITGYADAEVEKRLAEICAGWEKEAASGPRIVVFGCQRSAGMAWEELAQGARREVQGEIKEKQAVQAWGPGTVAFIGLPCAGKLDTDSLLKALAAGADGVLVLACPEENCRAQHGNTYARRRLDEARDYLQEAGLDPGRLRFDSLSSNMVHKLVETIDQFMRDLKA